jgi:hypothetical protein
MQFFETIFLEEADKFVQTLDKKSQQKSDEKVHISRNGRQIHRQKKDT